MRARRQDRHVVDHRRARRDRQRRSSTCCAISWPRCAPTVTRSSSSRRVRSPAGVAALGLPARPTDMPTLQAISAAGQSRLMEHLQPVAGPPRPGRRAGVARAARLRRPPAVPARPPDAGPPARAGLHPDHQRERRHRQPTRSATATTTASPRSSRTTSTPTCWCCSPTRRPVHRRPADRLRPPQLISEVVADDPLLDVVAPAPRVRPGQRRHGVASSRPRRWPRGRACAR